MDSLEIALGFTLYFIRFALMLLGISSLGHSDKGVIYLVFKTTSIWVFLFKIYCLAFLKYSMYGASSVFSSLFFLLGRHVSSPDIYFSCSSNLIDSIILSIFELGISSTL